MFLAILASTMYMLSALISNSVEESDEGMFYRIAMNTSTDKVRDHKYHRLYDRYLPAIRHQPIKMLEIGLGCGMVR